MQLYRDEINQIVVLVKTTPPEDWPIRQLPISPGIWEIVEQTAQDANASPATIINIFLAKAIVSIDNDET